MSYTAADYDKEHDARVKETYQLVTKLGSLRMDLPGVSIALDRYCQDVGYLLDLLAWERLRQ